MTNCCNTFFKENDQLGSGININYRGSSGFGTIPGGVLSLLATLFFTFFMGIQLYSWAFQPSYDQIYGVNYLDKQKLISYTIPVKKFVPTFLIRTNGKDEDDESGTEYYNNQTAWDAMFIQNSPNLPDGMNFIQPILCTDLFESWTDIPQTEADSFAKELGEFKEVAMCPNMTQFEIKGAEFATTQLILQIEATDKATDFIKETSQIITSEITHYFNPEDFSKQGIQKIVTLD